MCYYFPRFLQVAWIVNFFYGKLKLTNFCGLRDRTFYSQTRFICLSMMKNGEFQFMMTGNCLSYLYIHKH